MQRTMTRGDDVKTSKEEKKIWDALQVLGPGTKAIVALVSRNGLSEADVLAWVKYWTTGKEINNWGVWLLVHWLKKAEPGKRPPTTKRKIAGPNHDLTADRDHWKRELNALSTIAKQRLANHVRNVFGNHRAADYFDRRGVVEDQNAKPFIKAFKELEIVPCEE